MRTLVITNGPPGSGKDHAADCISHRYRTAFADNVKRDTHAYYKLGDIDIYKYEDCKDEPNNDFNGKTPREAYIHVSEEVMKPLNGNDHYGKRCAEDLIALPHSNSTCIDFVTGVGFRDEADTFFALINGLYDRIIFLRIHVSTGVTTFDEDSRVYLYPELSDHDILAFEIFNDRSGSFIRTIENILNL